MNLYSKNNLFRKAFLLLITPALFFSITISFAQAETGVPSILSYQGRLTDSSGNLLGGAGTPYFFKFSFWDSATVGAGSQVWPVASPAPVSLTVKQGVFNVNIGDIENSYPDILNYNFGSNKKIYLQVEASANNSSFETLSPRQRITSAPFAEVAASLAPDYLTSIFSNYFTKTESNNLYDFLGAASTTASTTIANHENLYNHSLIATALQSESDPLFMAASSSLPYQPLGFYLTSFTELDPVWSSTSWSTTTNNSTNWNTAFSWGSHIGLYDLLGTASSTASSTLSNWLASNPTSGTNTGDNAVNSLYSGLAASKQDALNGTGFIKSNGTSITYDNSTYLTAETDPTFTAWDKHAGISVTESQISDLKSYLTAESDTLASITARSASTSVETTFSGGLVTSKIRPATDTTTAIQFNKADGVTNILNIDTLNGRLGIGTTAPTSKLQVTGSTDIVQLKVIGNATQTTNIMDVFASDGTTAKFHIKGDGKVGIGTTAPNYGLHVNNTSTSSAFQITNSTTGALSTDGFVFGITDLDAWLINRENGKFTIRTNDLDRFIVSATGYVGIGQATPQTFIDVAGAIPNVVYGSMRLTDTTALGINNGGSLTFSGYYTGTTLISSWAKIGGLKETATDGEYSGYLNFQTRPQAGTLTERMRISSTGNVGIGTTAPTSKLQVNGSSDTVQFKVISNATQTTNIMDVFASDGTTAKFHIKGDGKVGIGTTAPATQLQIDYVGDYAIPALGASGGALSIKTAGVRGLIAGNTTGGNFFMQVQRTDGGVSAYNLLLQPNGGNVGIGTTAPAEKLHIYNGNIRIGNQSDGFARIFIDNSPYQATPMTLLNAVSRDSDNRSEVHLGGGTVNGYAATQLQFFTASNRTTTTGSERMRINSNGNVGIGTTAPGYKLDVKGLTASDGIRSGMGFDIYAVLAPTFASGNLALASGGSNLGIGIYKYSMTYLTALGETDVSTDGTITTDASNRKVTITVPVSTDPRVTARRIYRSPVGGATYSSKVVATINDNTTTTYLDDIDDANLTGSTAYFRSNTTTMGISLNGSTVLNVTPNVNANLFLGYNVGNSTLTNGRNTGVGQNVLKLLTTGSSNTSVGNSALASVSTGSFNIVMGYGSGNQDTTGDGNIAIGHDAGFYNKTGNNNVHVGHFSGFGVTGGANDVVQYSTGLGSHTNFKATNYALHLGSNAGRYETADSKLIIDVLDRGTEAAGRSSALLYGVFNATPANQILALGGGGKVGIGTTTPVQALTVVGNGQFTAVGSGAFSSDLSLTADGTLTTSASDIALKMNLVPLNATTTSTSSISILDKVIGLKPYTFNWISDPTGLKDIGLIAQDVEGIFPEITFTNKVDGYKGINYSRLPVILVSAIQELSDKVVKVGSYVVDGVAHYTHVIAVKFTGEEAEITNIKTEKVCIGETCIDEAMLKELILKNSITNTVTTNSSDIPETVVPLAATTTATSTATSTELVTDEPEATTTEEIIPEATSIDQIVEVPVVQPVVEEPVVVPPTEPIVEAPPAPAPTPEP